MSSENIQLNYFLKRNYFHENDIIDFLSIPQFKLREVPESKASH